MSSRGLKARAFPWISTGSSNRRKSILGLDIFRHLFSSRFARSSQMDQLSLTCDVDAEPLNRYRRGGYHPVCLGDLLKDRRYKILHKLGWGGYSTIWAARDQWFRVALPHEKCGANNCQGRTICRRQDLSLGKRKKSRTRSHACNIGDSARAPRLSASNSNAGSLQA
jgi:hypothetical protein